MKLNVFFTSVDCAHIRANDSGGGANNYDVVVVDSKGVEHRVELLTLDRDKKKFLIQIKGVKTTT